ncbi:MAG: hypothetical protein R6W85_08835 [Gillisia sp.]
MNSLHSIPFFNKVKINIWVFVCFFCFLGFTHYGQQILQFDDDYTLEGDLSGHAKFQYYSSGNRLIKNGDFRFEKVEKEVDPENVIESISLEGSYKQNIKSGKWQYRHHNLQQDRTPSVIGNEIVFSASGNSYVATAGFVDGKIHGPYEILHANIQGSLARDSIYYFKTSYTQGRMQGGFSGKNYNIAVQGNIDGMGMPDGEWQINHTGDIREYRIYDSGILKNHYFRIHGEIQNVNHIGLDVTKDQANEIWEKVPLNPKYFQVLFQTSIGLKETLSDNNTIALLRELIQSGNSFLEKAFFTANVYKERDIWQLIEGSIPAEPVMVKLRKYPYAENENEKYSSAKNILNEINSITKNYFENTHIEINRYTYKDITHNYKVMEILRDRTAELAPVVNMLSDNSSEYIDRDEIIKFITPSIDYPGSITYKFNEEDYTEAYDFPAGFTPGTITFSGISTHIQEILKRAGEINRETEGILAQYRTRTELQLQEDTLLQKRDSIIALFSNSGKMENYNEWHLEISTSVIVYVEQTFAHYASLPLEEKVVEIETTFACYENLAGLYAALEDLPWKLNRVDEVYTRTTWNPYTFTYMDEKVKERLFRAYKNEIFPYIWNDLKETMDCNTIDVKLENIDNLYKKMITLREEDTRHLERQIRRTRNIEELLNAISIQVN